MVLSENQISKIFIIQKNPEFTIITFISNINDINDILLFKRITDKDYETLLETNKYVSDELIIYCEPLNDNDLIKLNDN